MEDADVEEKPFKTPYNFYLHAYVCMNICTQIHLAKYNCIGVGLAQQTNTQTGIKWHRKCQNNFNKNFLRLSLTIFKNI